MFNSSYAAGFFDGEGCIRVDRIKIKSASDRPTAYTRYQLKVSVSQANPEILLGFRDKFGGSISSDTIAKKIRPNSRARHQWYAWSKFAYDFLVEIRPYLIGKAEEADLAIDFYAAMKQQDSHWRKHRGNPPDKAEILAARDVVYDKLAALKRRTYEFPTTVALP